MPRSLISFAFIWVRLPMMQPFWDRPDRGTFSGGLFMLFNVTKIIPILYAKLSEPIGLMCICYCTLALHAKLIHKWTKTGDICNILLAKSHTMHVTFIFPEFLWNRIIKNTDKNAKNLGWGEIKKYTEKRKHFSVAKVDQNEELLWCHLVLNPNS